MSHAEHENINHSHDPRQRPLGPGQSGRRGVMGFICEQENEVDKGSDSPVNEGAGGLWTHGCTSLSLRMAVDRVLIPRSATEG
ncbi:unnamed protein product [Arctogadus glacialis]